MTKQSRNKRNEAIWADGTGRLDGSGWDDLLVIENTESDKALEETR